MDITLTQSRLQDYFALRPTNEIGKFMMDKIDKYYEYLISSGKLNLWRKSYKAYYRGEMRGGRLRKTGRQNEYTVMNVNHYRNFLLHIVNQTTAQKPTPEPEAQNSDYESQAQTILARGALNYYDSYKHLERIFKRCAEYSAVYGEGYISLDFDTKAGSDLIPDNNGIMIKTGDIVFNVLSPVEVVRDIFSTPQNQTWKIVREMRNKFDLASKYSSLETEILKSTFKREQKRLSTFNEVDVESDMIAVWKLYHDKTSSVPNGRYVEMLDDATIIFDGALPYRKIYVPRMSAEDKGGESFGYTIGFDLLALQEAYDALCSIVMTNQSNFGVQNISMPRNSNLTVSSLTDGLNLIEYDPKAGRGPEGVNLTSTSPEIFNFIGMLERIMETISGVNSTVRGNPEASLKSGAALALIASQAIQFN